MSDPSILPDDTRLSNSFDIFVRGEEVLSEGQRLHSAYELEKALEEAGINPDYVNTFRWGCHLRLVEGSVGIYNHYQTTSHRDIPV